MTTASETWTDEEQTLIVDAVRTLVAERVTPRAAAIDETSEYPQHLREVVCRHD